jgi:hypothetical protein
MFTSQRIHHFIQFVALLFHPAFIFFPSGFDNPNFPCRRSRKLYFRWLLGQSRSELSRCDDQLYFNSERTLYRWKCSAHQTNRLQRGRSSTGEISGGLSLCLLSANCRSQNCTGGQKQLRLTFIPGATGAHYDYLDLTFAPDPSDPDGHPYNPYVAVWAQ